ncbi:MAG: hypothetical protein GZ089_06440, partial [Aromatoleum sp.]|nr:hypothetical protein [Aromatoleum sp.]
MKSSSASGASDATAAPPPRRRRWWRVLAAFVIAIALSIAAGVTWLGSRSALDFAIRQLQVRLGDRLVIEGASGALTSTLRARSIRYSTPDLTVTADDVAVTWSPMDLWSNRLRIDGLGAQRVMIEITSKNVATGMPESLALPVEFAIAHAGIAHLELRNGATTRAFDGIAFAYAGGPSVHALSDVALAFDAGRIKGEITLAATAPFSARGAFALEGAGPLARVSAKVDVGGSLAALDVKAALRFGETT